MGHFSILKIMGTTEINSIRMYEISFRDPYQPFLMKTAKNWLISL